MTCLTEELCLSWRKQNSRKRTWKRQITCITPLKRLNWFASESLQLLQPFNQALILVDEIVFDVPEKLLAIRHAAGETRPVHESPGLLFVDEPRAFAEALEIAWNGWIDFRVLFDPPRHAIVADHDEYTTFLSESSGKIAEIREAFRAGGLSIQEYVCDMP